MIADPGMLQNLLIFAAIQFVVGGVGLLSAAGCSTYSCAG